VKECPCDKSTISIRDPAGRLLPSAEAGQRFFAHQGEKWNAALGQGDRDLLVNEGVVEARLGGVGGE
jgi:hypothetical protein